MERVDRVVDVHVKDGRTWRELAVVPMRASQLSLASLRDAVARVPFGHNADELVLLRSKGATLVELPSREPWPHHLVERLEGADDVFAFPDATSVSETLSVPLVRVHLVVDDVLQRVRLYPAFWTARQMYRCLRHTFKERALALCCVGQDSESKVCVEDNDERTLRDLANVGYVWVCNQEQVVKAPATPALFLSMEGPRPPVDPSKWYLTRFSRVLVLLLPALIERHWLDYEKVAEAIQQKLGPYCYASIKWVRVRKYECVATDFKEALMTGPRYDLVYIESHTALRSGLPHFPAGSGKTENSPDNAWWISLFESLQKIHKVPGVVVLSTCCGAKLAELLRPYVGACVYATARVTIKLTREMAKHLLDKLICGFDIASALDHAKSDVRFVFERLAREQMANERPAKQKGEIDTPEPVALDQKREESVSVIGSYCVSINAEKMRALLEDGAVNGPGHVSSVPRCPGQYSVRSGGAGQADTLEYIPLRGNEVGVQYESIRVVADNTVLLFRGPAGHDAIKFRSLGDVLWALGVVE